MGLQVGITDSGVDISKINLEKISSLELPSFAASVPDLKAITEFCSAYQNYSNIIIIGNGGSVNNSLAYYNTLGSAKNVFFLKTMEPDYINELKTGCPKEDTIVIAISKSGTTVGVLESLLSFVNDGYRCIAITNTEKGALLEIANKKGFEVMEHPDVGGRFSARTSCALVPAQLFGADIHKLEEGFNAMYSRCSPDKPVDENPALKLAAVLHELEKTGKTEVFLPVYSAAFSGFLPIIIQLMHESVCKEGRGQTFFGSEAPESQHHTNQRFFGGMQNIAGLFVVAEQKDNNSRITVPDALKDVKLRDGSINDLAGVPYEKALEFEFLGTYRDAVNKNIPVCVVRPGKVSAETAGEFMAFWQYVAVYSAFLRGVNPYDQPQVEASKDISFRMRIEYK